MPECEYRAKQFVSCLPVSSFCTRACSDAWHAAERREGVDWYRASGLRPVVPATRQEAAA